MPNSPYELGTLQLDRTGPGVTPLELTPQGGEIRARWYVEDPLSGTDPSRPVVAEVNTDAGGGATGAWLPFGQQPDPGDGPKVATTRLAGLPDGRHLVRVRARDRAGNESAVVLGTTLSDGTAPVVTDARVTTAPRAATRLAEITYSAVDPDGGVGFGPEPATAGPVGAPGIDWGRPAARAGRVLVALPEPGDYRVEVRVSDAVGNVGVSAPVAVHVPTAAEEADLKVDPAPKPAATRRPGEGAGPLIGWAYGRTQAFHRSRARLQLTARVRVARSSASWKRLLGTPYAGRFQGFATMRGQILLGPAAARGLEALGRWRRATLIGARTRPPSRADIDRMALGLAVLLHESIHATGPAARTDVTTTRSGRAFEEGFTEAATVDLLPAYVRSLGLPARLRAPVLAGVRRYRPAYPAERAWARGLSAAVTGRPAGSATARRWRIAVADRWGANRWALLAQATGRDAAALRAEAPGVVVTR
ncbi:MAG: hypothetical protein AB7V42_13230 [Thermoleophilia bacterium]